MCVCACVHVCVCVCVCVCMCVCVHVCVRGGEGGKDTTMSVQRATHGETHCT